MSGTIPLSMTQQLDIYGQPLAGGHLYIIQAGTVSTPQNPYQDAALTIVMPNPITLDAAGRIPQFFLADGFIKIRLTDTHGIAQLTADGILVIGPSTTGGGGGGGSVDPTTVLQTGDVKARYDTGVVTGFVRLNARTIGSASSGATELADASAQALFNYLWNKDNTLVVIPGRGGSSAADWASNRQITLPDWRGYALTGLDDMGNAPANRLTPAGFGASGTILGSSGGTEMRTMTQNQMPSHLHGAAIYDPTHQHTATTSAQVPSGGGTLTYAAGGFNFVAATVNIAGAATGVRVWDGTTFDVTFPAGGGAPMPTMTPAKLLTIYMKL